MLLENRKNFGDFCIYLYKFTPQNEKISDIYPERDYEVSLCSERGVMSIFCNDEAAFIKAEEYLTRLFGRATDDHFDSGVHEEHIAVLWE